MQEFKIAGKSYMAPDRTTALRMHDDATRRARETPLALHTTRNVDIQASHAPSRWRRSSSGRR